MQLVLFNPKIGPYQVLPFQERMGLGVMAMKGCSAFPKAPTSGTSLSDCLVSYPGHSLRRSYPSAEVQSVYSTAPADWVIVLDRNTFNHITVQRNDYRQMKVLLKNAMEH